MDSRSKDGDSDSGAFYGLKIYDLLKTLTERKSPSVSRRNISTAPAAPAAFRSRAVLPENLNRLSIRRFERRDGLRESAAASPPTTAGVASSREGRPRPSLPSLHPVTSALLLPGEPKMLPSGMQPHSLGARTWPRRASSRKAPWTPPEPPRQTGPTSEWFFEDLEDLQRKLFLGASKKSGVPRTH